MKKGIFISVEGLDGSGRFTVIHHLISKWFPDAVVTKQPLPEFEKFLVTQGISAECMALSAATSLQFAVDTVINPALADGGVVISNRFCDWMYAYQGYGQGFDIDWLDDLAPSIFPDLTIFLDCDPKTTLSWLRYKEGPDRVEKEGLEFYTRVRKGFLDLAEYYCERIVTINVERQLEEVLEDVDKAVEEVLK